MKKFLSVIALLLVMASMSSAQNLKFFKLGNGMSVYIWEDHSVPSVYGEVVVGAGSIDDPEQYTGLAHYLEHMMFKGTRKIGALDWEAESPLYEQIIALYDEMAQETDPAAKAALSARINELSLEESRLTVLNEYSNLIEGIGGSGLNAATSYDQTFFHNTFPSNQISKWLPLAAERFIDPVFRAFQSELETVYEEYNLYEDQASSRESDFLLSKVFEGTPYERKVIGLGEHLKNPRLSKLIEFYNNWYVPGNMALILVGDVDAAKTFRLINATFGRLLPKPTPERIKFEAPVVAGRKQYTYNYSQYPSVVLSYNTVPKGHPDEIALELCMQLLSNNSSTGILDRKSIAGDFMQAFGSSFVMKQQGRALIGAVPYYDNAQRAFDSSKKVERLLLAAVSELAGGNFSEEELEHIKVGICRDYDLQLEDSDFKAAILRETFVNGIDINTALAYKDRIMAVSADDIKAVASRYFGKDFTVIYNEKGRVPASQKIEKPEYKPLEPAKGKSSAYAAWFRGMGAPDLPLEYVDWSKVKEQAINSYSRLYYTESEENDVFTLVLKYGANSKDLPKLQYGASLMNTAGIMGSFDSQQIREEFAKLGASYTVSADNDYMYVTLRGYEVNLEQACLLLTRLLLMPKLDDKQLGNVIGSEASMRMVRHMDINTLAEALREQMIYGDESRYRKEMTDMEIVNLDIAGLTGSVLEATKYAAEIHYSGQLPFDVVSTILSRSLPLQEGEKPSSSPVVRNNREYDSNTVLFLPTGNFNQTQIFFYIPMGEYDKSSDVEREAFNRYFGGGFNGLVMQEIREYNSMAYTASGSVVSRCLPGAGQFLLGYIGTQNDKALDAIRLFKKLIDELPEHPENLESIRSFLLQDELVNHPDSRDLSDAVAEWKREGYDQDPAVLRVPRIKDLTFEDIIRYYNENVKGKPMVIAVVGNPKYINAKQLSEFGTVETVNEKSLFNTKDALFH